MRKYNEIRILQDIDMCLPSFQEKTGLEQSELYLFCYLFIMFPTLMTRDIICFVCSGNKIKQISAQV